MLQKRMKSESFTYEKKMKTDNKLTKLLQIINIT